VSARKGRDPQGTGTPVGGAAAFGKILFFAAMLNKGKAKNICVVLMPGAGGEG